MSEISPPRLVERAQRGDVGAFEELYRAQVGAVFAVCLRLVADRELAEDLTQEAFVRAWQRLHTFRGQSAFSTWLHRLTVNLALGHLRRQGRRGEVGQREPIESRAPVRRPEARIDLERAIAELPRGARTVFVLYELEGYRHKEIAELTGLAEGTCKAQLHRARKMLRKELTR